MSLPSSSNSRSSTVHSLSGKTQGLKFMQRAGIKKKDDFDNKSTSSNPSTPNKFNNSLQQDSIADSSFQSNASSSSAVTDSFEQWSIPGKKPLSLNQNSISSRFQPELAWNSWHLHSQNDDDDADEDQEQDEKNQITEKDDDFNFVSDDYRPAVGKRRKRYGEWAVQKRKKQKRSKGDQDDQDDDESDLDESREPLLEDSEEEEKSRSKPKKVKKESKKSSVDSDSNSKKFLKPGGSQTGIKKKKTSQDLLPSGARKNNSSTKGQSNKNSSSNPSSLGDFQAQQDERSSIREKKREKLSKGK